METSKLRPFYFFFYSISAFLHFFHLKHRSDKLDLLNSFWFVFYREVVKLEIFTIRAPYSKHRMSTYKRIFFINKVGEWMKMKKWLLQIIWNLQSNYFLCWKRDIIINPYNIESVWKIRVCNFLFWSKSKEFFWKKWSQRIKNVTFTFLIRSRLKKS